MNDLHDKGTARLANAAVGASPAAAINEDATEAAARTPGRIRVGSYTGEINGSPHDALSLWPETAIEGQHGHHVALIAPLENTSARDHANAERLAECWNACEGIEDPATAINYVREVLAGVKTRLDDFREHKSGLAPLLSSSRVETAINLLGPITL